MFRLCRSWNPARISTNAALSEVIEEIVDCLGCHQGSARRGDGDEKSAALLHSHVGDGFDFQVAVADLDVDFGTGDESGLLAKGFGNDNPAGAVNGGRHAIRLPLALVAALVRLLGWRVKVREIGARVLSFACQSLIIKDCMVGPGYPFTLDVAAYLDKHH